MSGQKHATSVEIPEGTTSLIGEDTRFSYNGLFEYDIIDKLVFPSTLRLDIVPQVQHEPIINSSFELGHPKMYFSSYESPGFMSSRPVECKRVQIGEIENHSPHILVEDGVSFCDNLSKINFPEGMEEIGARAFYPSRLTRAVFPTTLKKIECEAFYHNSRLRYIRFKSDVKISQAAFACTPHVKIIHKLDGMKIPSNVFEEDKSLDKFGFWD